MSKKKMEITIPKPEEVPALTDRLVEIDASLKALAAEKKDIEARLEAYALSQPEAHEKLKDERRDGRRVMLPGARARLPVVFSSDLIIGSFQDGGAKHEELVALLADVTHVGGDKHPLHLFFDPPAKWENRFDDGAKFRAAAREWLGDELGARFVAACLQRDKFGIAKSKTAFDYKAAEAVPAETEG